MTDLDTRHANLDISSSPLFPSSSFSKPSARTGAPEFRTPPVMERPSSRRLRRMTTAGSIQQSLDMDRTMEAVAEDDTVGVEPRIALRSRPSWMRRLSNLSPSGYSTPSTNSRPASASMSFSAGSNSFSQAGSTVPIFGGPQKPLPPNKLVKRSSSFRVANGAVGVEGSSRGPLTSHQRMATLRARPASAMGSLEWTEPEPSRVREQQSKSKWRHYFSAMVVGTTSDGSKSRATDVKAVRRILPDEKGQPVLVMAKSIAATSVDVDETLRMSHDAESFMFGSSSRPMTPAAFDDALSSRVSTAPSKRSRPGADSTTDEVRPRRSFSISDLLSRGPSSKKSSSNASFGDKFLRRGRRISSAPTRLMTTRQSIELQHDRERPSKRRDITEPSNTTIPPPSTGDSQRSGGFGLPVGTPLSPLVTPSPPKNISAALLIDEKTTLVHEDLFHAPDHSPLASKVPSAMAGRYSKHRIRTSVSHSEQASTIGGSDVETRGMSSGDDDDTDMTSDTVFDSVRTRATRSTSGAGARGPRIETIFDESPPHKSLQLSLSKVQDQFPDKILTDLDIGATSWHENEAISTPTAGKSGSGDGLGAASLRDIEKSPARSSHFHSSPPDFSHLTLSEKQRTQQGQGEDMEWSYDDSEPESMRASATEDEADGIEYERVATPLSIHRSNPTLVDTSSSSTAATPQNCIGPAPSQAGRGSATRNSAFDWSEPTDTSPRNRTPPRPKTVHGKRQPGPRGSRSIGRRAPSSLHTRSQSVPVVPDMNGKRESPVGNKFGTWGAGQIEIEEWDDDDFDFAGAEQRRVDSGTSIFVPQVIRDQQDTVNNARGLLYEWLRLVAQLKAIDGHASRLRITNGPDAETFRKVKAVIALSDENLPGASIPPPLSTGSSPSVKSDIVEEEPSVASLAASLEDKLRLKAGSSSSAGLSEPIMQMASAARNRRKSVLPSNSAIFSPPAQASGSIAAVFEDEISPAGNIQETSVLTSSKDASVSAAKVLIEQIQNTPVTPQSWKRGGFRTPEKPVLASTKEDFEVTTTAIVENVHALPEPFTAGNLSTQETSALASPKENSEATADVEPIQSNHAVPRPSTPVSFPTQAEANKAPFDAEALRYLVPFVRDILSKAKDAVRMEEALYNSPNVSPKVPLEVDLAQFKRAPPDGSPSVARGRRVSRNAMMMETSDTQGLQTPEKELTTQLKLMTVM
ncbi:hypothetical protein NA57DRAFT_80371 [Rhizodiscina lignyota]|uniref:Uncharacterized protein n=1 Tax=Rhizodiscina lignyota TaxID=1504668 RepID=A0A9P4M685_9PEZI|nr:hypothetical protein NA57DRAFT_80371 [Rhizodiscina lignyota]